MDAPGQTPATSEPQRQSWAAHSRAARLADSRPRGLLPPLCAARPAPKNSASLRAEKARPLRAFARNKNTAHAARTTRVSPPVSGRDADDTPRDQAEAVQKESSAGARERPSGEKCHARKRPAGDRPSARTRRPGLSSAKTRPQAGRAPCHSSYNAPWAPAADAPRSMGHDRPARKMIGFQLEYERGPGEHKTDSLRGAAAPPAQVVAPNPSNGSSKQCPCPRPLQARAAG